MKRDELNNLHISNTDGQLPVKESSLGNLKEIKEVQEVKQNKDEVFKPSEENNFAGEEKQSCYR